MSFRAEACVFLLEPTRVAPVIRRALSSLYQLSELCQVLAAGISRAPSRLIQSAGRATEDIPWLITPLPLWWVSSPGSLPALVSLQLYSFTVAASQMP